MASILETIMLVCFGLSWPINLVKAYRSRTARGTSLPFILLITFGYVAGISAKLINLSNTKIYVLVTYIINLVMVLLNLVVYFRNSKLDAEADRK